MAEAPLSERMRELADEHGYTDTVVVGRWADEVAALEARLHALEDPRWDEAWSKGYQRGKWDGEQIGKASYPAELMALRAVAVKAREWLADGAGPGRDWRTVPFAHCGELQQAVIAWESLATGAVPPTGTGIGDSPAMADLASTTRPSSCGDAPSRSPVAQEDGKQFAALVKAVHQLAGFTLMNRDPKNYMIVKEYLSEAAPFLVDAPSVPSRLSRLERVAELAEKWFGSVTGLGIDEPLPGDKWRSEVIALRSALLALEEAER